MLSVDRKTLRQATRLAAMMANLGQFIEDTHDTPDQPLERHLALTMVDQVLARLEPYAARLRRELWDSRSQREARDPPPEPEGAPAA